MGTATVLASRAVDTVAVNRAIGFGVERAFGAAQLAEIRAFFQQQGKARWFLECSPDASVDTGALVAAGGVLGGSQIKLVATMDEVHRPWYRFQENASRAITNAAAVGRSED